MYRVQNVLGRQMLQRTETPRKIPASAVQPQHSPMKVASAQVKALYSLNLSFVIIWMVLEVRICTYIAAHESRCVLHSQSSVGAKRRWSAQQSCCRSSG